MGNRSTLSNTHYLPSGYPSSDRNRCACSVKGRRKVLDTKRFDYTPLEGIQEISYLLVAYKSARRYHQEYKRKMMKVQRRGQTKKQMKKKSHKNLQRRIIKSNRNMAKGVEGCAWCKDKETKTRPMAKNILKMIVLASYKNMPSFKLQRSVSGNGASVQEIEVV